MFLVRGNDNNKNNNHNHNKNTNKHLFLKQQRHAIPHLVAVDGGECDVEKEAVEDGLGDPLQWEGQQQQRHPNQDVGRQRGEPGLLHLHNAAHRQTETHWVTHSFSHTHTHAHRQVVSAQRRPRLCSCLVIGWFL